ncbi:MAG TPA: autotransporter-associated beta strand repeat-containing protein, partial [Tepidisphaeraceae bacterium]|nr:autotransporter-associated beta strand repeat-containing protein [Tepidisphaeraceae bacterium]
MFRANGQAAARTVRTGETSGRKRQAGARAKLGRAARAALVAGAVLGAGGGSALAADIVWTAGSGAAFNWSDGLNWDLTLEPNATHDAQFNSGIPNPGSLANPEAIVLSAGELANSLTFNDAYTLTGGTLQLSLPGNVTVGSGATATIASALVGPGGITKLGDGTLALSGPNTYAGVTAVQAGTLNFSASAHLGDNSATNGLALSNGGILRWTGGAATDLGVDRALALGAGGGTIDAAGAALTISGALTGSGPLTKTGGGTVILSGNSPAYTGNVFVNSGASATAGVLRLASNTALTAGTVDLSNTSVAGGTGTILDLANVSIGSGVSLVMNSNIGGSFRTTLSGSGTSVWNGSVQVKGDGVTQFTPGAGATLTLNGNVTNDNFTGVFFMRGTGTLQLNGNVDIGAGAFTHTDSGTVVVNSPTTVIAASVRAAHGTIKLGKSNVLPSGVQFTVGQTSDTSGTFDLAGFDQTFAGLERDAASTGTAHRVVNSGVALSTLTLDMANNYSFTSATLPQSAVIGVAGQANIRVVKKGAGTQTLGGTNLFSGGLTINGGRVAVATEASLGTGTVTLDQTGVDPVGLDYTGNTVTNSSATRGFAIGAAGASLNFTTAGGGLRVAGALSGAGALTVDGPGTLYLTGNTAGYTGGITATNGAGLGVLARGGAFGNITSLSSTSTLFLVDDGDGTSGPETLVATGTLPAGTTSVGVDRASNTPLFTGAANKTIQVNSGLSTAGQSFTVTNANGYGLHLTGGADTGAAGNNPTYTVSGASASNLPAGLTLGGVVSGGSGFIKAGAGTLALTNAGNTFGGAGELIDITGGVVAASSDGALGNAANGIRLNAPTTTSVGFTSATNSTTITLTSGTTAGITVGQPISGANLAAGTVVTGVTGATTFTISANPTAAGATTATVGVSSGLRATGSFTTARTIDLAQPTNAIEVTGGNTLTLTTPFALSGGAGAALTKSDNGVLAISAANGGWTGGVTIYGGAVRAQNNAALGTGGVTIPVIGGGTGMALQLAGGVTVNNALTITAPAGATQFTGIQSGGVLEAVSGVNTFAGAINQGANVGLHVGAQAGATLNITGGITATNSLNIRGAGTVNITGAAITNNVINKLDSGTATIGVALPSFAATGTIGVSGGTLAIAGNGVGIGGTGAATVSPGATLRLDDSAGASTQRLGARPLTLTSGNLTLLGNAANSAQTIGALTVNGASTITSTTGGGAGVTSTTTFTSATFGANSATITFDGAGLGTVDNRIIFTTAPALTNGMLARGVYASGGAFEFATYGANGVQVFATYNAAAGSATDVNAAVAATTLSVTGATTTKTLSAARTINALKIDGTGLTVDAAATTGTPFALTLSSGGLLATGGSNAISAPALAFGAEAFVHVNAGSTLTINSAMSGGTGLAKTSGGTLIINPGASAVAGVGANTLSGGSLAVNGGTVRLGSTNAYAPNTFLRVSPGGTFDLGGNLQQFQGVFTDAAVAQTAPGQQGTITSTGGAGTLVINQDNAARNWAGRMTGALSLLRGGQNTLPVFSDNDHTGVTTLNGGTTLLRDAGRLSGTSALGVDYAVLTIDNNVGSLDHSDRVNDAAPVTLRGGTIVYTGRGQTASSESMGALTLAQASNDIQVLNTAGGVSSAELTFASLNRSSTDATLNLRNVGVAGSGGRLKFATPPTLSNRIIGGWAVVGGNEFATYSAGTGVGALGQAGFASYDATSLAGATAAQNVRITGAGAVTAGGQSVNTLVMSGNAPVTFAAGTDTLNLVGGGLIKIGANTVSIGAAVDSGRLTAGGSATGIVPLYVHINVANTSPLTINSRIVDNPDGGKVRLVYTAYNGGTLNLTNPNNSYTGGTVVNGGSAFTGTLNLSGAPGAVVIPAGGLTISGATVNMVTNGGQIDASNVVTLNGGASVLTLGRNNTLAGLVINNVGGGATVPTVNTGGTLTLTGGITTTGSNVTATPVINGRWDLGATGSKTVTVAPNQFNGLTINPLIADLALTGLTGAAGLTKDGAGLLQFNAQAGYTGATTVNAGGIKFGAANAGPRYSAVTLNGAGTRIDLGGVAGGIGSLAGTGTVVNSSTTAATLTVGGDNASTTFAGGVRRFSDSAGAVASTSLTKVGAGTMTLTGASNSAGTLTVAQGAVNFSGATGTGFFGTYLVQSGGTLTTDGATPVANRLGTATGNTLNIGGGTVNLAGTVETFGNLTASSGGGTLNLAAPAGGPLTVNVGALTALQAGGSLLIRGNNFGSAPGSGVPSVNVTTYNVPAGQGTGANGTVTMAIRPDILGDASATGVGTAFVTRDSVGLYLRPLTAAEQASAIVAGQTVAATNVGVSSVQSLSGGTQPVNSLSLGAGGGIAIAPAALASNTTTVLTITTGGVLARNGNAGITAGQLATTNNAPFLFHVVNDTAGTTSLTVDAILAPTTGGMTKAGDGTLTLTRQARYTGTTTVNAGRLVLGGGDNTLPVVPTTGAPTAQGLTVNGTGTVDLNGFNQTVGTLTNNNAAAGSGGTVTNTAGGPAATLTSITGAASTFAGSLAGNLNFTKTGNNALTLTSASTHTGATVVRGNALNLRDAGSILNTSSITANYGTLNIDQSGLNPVADLNPTRVAATTPLTLNGGGLTFTPGASLDTSATINTVTAASAHNTINAVQAPVGSTGTLSIGNLVVNPDTTVNFTGGNASGFFSTVPGLNISQVFVGSINGVAIPANITGKILGGWAVVNNGEFATYIQSGTAGNAGGVNWGIATMNNAGVTGLGITQGAYDATAIAVGDNPTINVRMTATTAQTIGAGGATINALAVRGALPALNFTNATDTLNLVSGGLALTTGGTIVGTVGNGQITAGGTQSSGIAPLYVHSSATSPATNTISAAIVDNGSGAKTRLVTNLISSTLVLNGNNTYTGGTVFGGGATVSLAGSGITIPAGGVTINNSTVTMTTNAGQIESSNAVTINGGGALNLVGANTLDRVTFNNNGGTANPTVGTAAGLTLTAAAAITAVNDNPATTPTVGGLSLILGHAAPVISTAGLADNGLNITAPITSAGGFTKTGAGSLALTPTQTIATGTTTGSANVTVPNTGILAVGQGVSGTGIPANSYITAIVDGSTITLSQNATATAAAVNLNYGNLYSGPTTVAAGTLRLGNATALPFTSTVTVNPGATLDINGQATLIQSPVFNGVVTNNGAAATLSVGGTTPTETTSATNVTINGPITNGANALTLQKAGAGTLTFAAPGSNYTGNTIVRAGGLAATVANAFSPNSTIVLGNAPASPLDPTTAATTATLDLGGQSQTIGGLTLQSSSETANTVTIAAGKTLTITGNLTVGYNVNAPQDSPLAAKNLLTFAGTGSLVMNNQNAVVSVGVSQSNQTGSTAIPNMLSRVDATSLSNVSLGTVASPIATINVGFGTTDPGTLLLSNTANSLAATTLNVGHSNGANPGTGIVTLGTGTNLINANTINIGFSKANGTVSFASQTAGSPGTVTIANKAGTGGADLTVGSQFGTGTASILTGTLDLRGHVANVTANNVVVGLTNNNNSNGTASGVISMDAGTFTAATLSLGSRVNGPTGTGTGNTNTATLNIGGGSFAVAGATTMATSTITANNTPVTGTLNLTGAGSFTTATINAANKSAAGTGIATANINVGGTAALTVTGNQFVLATHTGSGSAVGTLNITGGTVSTQADITDGGGTSTTTVTLDGGALNMNGKAIGSAANLINNVNLRSGTLSNLGQLNNGAALTKTTAGTLIVDGANAYTGATNVTAGTLRSNGSIAASSGVTVADGGAKFVAGATQTIKKLDLSAGATG